MYQQPNLIGTNVPITSNQSNPSQLNSFSMNKFLPKLQQFRAAGNIAEYSYDSINVSSLTNYDDTSGITISTTADESVTTDLNSAALTKINTLTSRLKKNFLNRPKLNQGKLEDNLKQMYIERIRDYKEAQITIEVDDTPIPNIISKIKQALSKL